MRRVPQSLRRHSILLLLLLALTPLAPIRANDPDQPDHTHFSGQLPPPETNGTATIQWGGGTLYQLTARLAVNGCDLNLLHVWDDQIRSYTGYTFDGPTFLNAPFHRKYADTIPASTIWVKCIDMIEHVYGYGLLNEQQKQEVDAKDKMVDFARVDFSDCGDYWQQQTRDDVLPVIPTPQNICLTYTTGHGGGLYVQGLTQYLDAILHVVKPHVAVVRSGYIGPDLVLEWHELCHANQSWNLVKYNTGSDLLEASTASHPEHRWYMTEQGRSFIDLFGFQQDQQGGWLLSDDDNAYDGLHNSDYYTSDPQELSAELCAGYLMTKAQVQQDWTEYYAPYLTDEVIAWLEQYVFVLPESRIGAD